MTVGLAAAKALRLMGRPESWGNRGGKPLELVPDGVLKQARRFFADLLREGTKSARMEEQIAAIDLVLADREAHSPQQSLGL